MKAKREARFAVGIDLGTTNSVVAYVELTAEAGVDRIDILSIPQVVSESEVADRPLLPSFLWLPSPHELKAGALALPWDSARDFAAGDLARERAALSPGSVVASAKSWLCHAGVDRRAPLLPVAAEKDQPRLSPLEVSARLLTHLREAWDSAMPAPLAEQEVTLTVPASFDAVARELTSEAARLAGLENAVLLEEPQAALYAWVHAAGNAWRKQIRVGDRLLVVDIGGGTSDFSLIAVSEESGQLRLDRLAVGDHILLGGDNVDLALAHTVAGKLAEAGRKLDAWQMHALTHACRRAKELAFSAKPPATLPVAIPGRGSGLVGGTVKSTLTRSDIDTMLDAFFPEVEAAARPQVARRSGLAELGLPYANDPAVTRHLAGFLGRHGEKPTALLFNGGVFKAARLQERLVGIVGNWLGQTPRQLSGTSLDLAVAQGAAYFSLVRRGRGIRIRGGMARNYYVGVEASVPAVPGIAPPMRAVCLAPFGMEEGTSVELPQLELGAVVGEPAHFRFFSSSVRRGDVPGTMLGSVSELEELPPLSVTLPPSKGHREGDVVPVEMHATATEIGTLRLDLAQRGGDGSWKLEFGVRSAEPSA